MLASVVNAFASLTISRATFYVNDLQHRYTQDISLIEMRLLMYVISGCEELFS